MSLVHRLLIALALLATPGAAFQAHRSRVPTQHVVRENRWVAAQRFTVLKSEAESAEAETPAAPAAEAGEEASPAAASADVISIESLEIDQEIQGVAKGVSDFGVFVDFGAGTDGLVHKSQMSDDFVETPSEHVSVGDKISARIIRIDLEKNQVSLSMKSKKDRPARRPRSQSPRNEDLSKFSAMDPTAFITGTVKTLATYGAFVEVEGGVTGLVHISQLSADRVESVEAAVSVGQEVQVRVISAADGKLSLSMAPYKEPVEGEEKSQGRGRRGRGDGPRERKPREERVEDIWTDNTEPEWRKFASDMAPAEFDNVLELKL